ncbi:hypothetical protein BST61_g1056 [Cercospora zeina]
MAQRRSLGGGRVLGSGKNLAPATPSPSPAPPKNGQLAQRPALLSPSNSSISLSSRASSTPITTDTEDLTSRVALDTDGVAQAAAAATNRMVCPICNEEMVTLLQLNRHIDDNHANLERIEQQEAQDWFKQQMTKAKKFQPLALINQKLRGLEVFESNNEVAVPSTLPRIASGSRDASPAPVPKVQQEPPNPDDVVTRAHWQRPRGNDACSDPMCGLGTMIIAVWKGITSIFSARLTRLTQLLADPPPPVEENKRASLDVDTKKPGAEKVAVDVRTCRDCQRTIFSKADFARELDQTTPDQRAYNNLVQFEQGIRLLLPKFQRLLGPLQDPEKPPSPAQLAEASKVRKRLTEAFTQYDVAARRIRDMPTDSQTQERLQRAIYMQASNFLHIHMLPLKSLPKIMKHATPNGLRQPPSSAANGKPQSALATIKYDSIANGSAHRPGSSRASSMSSEAVTALEAEEKELKQRLIVLEEQKFMVSEMIAEANKRRKFDEVSALSSNVEEISREIDQIQTQISGMDFASAYIADQVIK